MNQSPRIIEVIVKPDGSTRVQTRGFAGSSCRDASRLLEQALGPVRTQTLTPEFYQTASNRQQINEKN